MASISSLQVGHSEPPLPRIATITGVIFLMGLALVALVVTAGLAARPELQAAGARHVASGLVAGVGTAGSALVAVVAYAGPWTVARRLRTSGGATALATLGWGRVDLLRACLPLACVGVLMALAASSVVEPSAWRAVHQIKGSPVASAAVWGRLQAGEVAVLPEGGAAVLGAGRLRTTAGDGSWSAEFETPAPTDVAWTFGRAALHTGEQGSWTADRLTLHLLEEPARAWRSPPTSPWAASLRDLVRRDDRRSRRVLHRRLASVALVLPLIALGLGLGWGAGRLHLGASVALPLVLFVVTRSLDGSGLAPWVIGWSPTLLATALAAALWRHP